MRKGFAGSDEPTRNYHLNLQLASAFTEPYASFSSLFSWPAIRSPEKKFQYWYWQPLISLWIVVLMKMKTWNPGKWRKWKSLKNGQYWKWSKPGVDYSNSEENDDEWEPAGVGITSHWKNSHLLQVYIHMKTRATWHSICQCYCSVMWVSYSVFGKSTQPEEMESSTWVLPVITLYLSIDYSHHSKLW